MSGQAPNATVTTRLEAGSRLLILGVTSDAGPLAFVPGQFVNLALPGPDGGKLLARPYSVASPPGAPVTEFALTRVDLGALTPRLWALEVGHRLVMETVAAGSFTLRDVPPRAPLLVVATGTGTAPFMSMLRAGEWKDREVTVVHGARTAEGLAYAAQLKAAQGVRYLPTVTQDLSWQGERGRVQSVLEALRPLAPETQALLCGNPGMIREVRELLEGWGFRKHRKKEPGNLRFEAYW